MDIAKIDPNLAVKRLDRDDVAWFDVRNEPFGVYGLYNYREGKRFCRIPRDVAEATSPGVLSLYANTAGGRVRFKTDSPYVAIRAEMPNVSGFPHMPMTGTSGFDLYQIRDGYQTYARTFVPPYDMTRGYESLHWVGNGEMCEYLINFPLYNDVDNLFIGVQEGSKIEAGGTYRNDKPVVYYGSSITQGGCASRPGNSYQGFISRALDLDYINLGFSGSARGEDAIAEYMAGLSMSVFVSDYDHNAPGIDGLRNTHYKMYQKIREKNPTVPYVIVSKPDVDIESEYTRERLSVILETYLRAWKQGDKNVYFVNGAELFGGHERDACTVDGCHPNDLGFYRMAEAIGAVLKRLF